MSESDRDVDWLKINSLMKTKYFIAWNPGYVVIYGVLITEICVK
jgi:hypothetical protein